MNDKCFECESPATEDHHVIPQSYGGTKTVRLCGSCHNKVHQGGWKRRDDHSQLTIEGLRKARERGVVLGNKTNLDAAQSRGQQAQSIAANAFALDLYPTILNLRESGMTIKEVAAHLNNAGIETARGGKWHTSSVRNIIERAENILDS